MPAVRSMIQELSITAEGIPSQLYADASAALSIAKKQGAGKMGHINVKEVQRASDYLGSKGEESPPMV